MRACAATRAQARATPVLHSKPRLPSRATLAYRRRAPGAPAAPWWSTTELDHACQDFRRGEVLLREGARGVRLRRVVGLHLGHRRAG